MSKIPPTTFYFVLTSPCPTATLGLSCDTRHLEIQVGGPSYVFEHDSLRQWGLGNRVKQLINVPSPILDGDTIRNMSLELASHYDSYLESQYPLAKVKILCGPCKCAVRTALEVCREQSKKEINYSVCIDDRMQTSCCPGNKKLQRLRDLFRTLRAYDEEWRDIAVIGLEKDLLTRVDRVHLEQRIYQLETEVYEGETNKAPAQQMSDLLVETLEQYNRDIPVFLCEAITCAWFIQKKPFLWSPRVPRESEIFKFTKEYFAPTFSTHYLGTFTSKKSQVPHSDSGRPDGGRRPVPSVASTRGAGPRQPSLHSNSRAPSPATAESLESRNELIEEEEVLGSSGWASTRRKNNLEGNLVRRNSTAEDSDRPARRLRSS